MVDTHCHLLKEYFAEDVANVVARAQENGVGIIISCGVDIDSSRESVKTAGEFSGVWATVGVHPEAASKENVGTKDKLRELARLPKVVAIGECGLDYHWAMDREEKEKQRELFSWQLLVASELGLPITIHNREADDDILSMIAPYTNKLTGVMHCFSGDWDFAQKIIQLGFYISFAGNVTYKKNVGIQEVAKTAPIERILTETDAPYLPPEPNRGRWPNTPANVRITSEFIANLRRMTNEELALQTRQNAALLFNLTT